MSKTGLTIQKEIQKKEHEKTPLGQVEKKLRNFYDNLLVKGEKLPEYLAKQIYDLRDEHESKQLKYIEDTEKEQAIAVDKMLYDTMSSELTLLEKYVQEKKE